MEEIERTLDEYSKKMAVFRAIDQPVKDLSIDDICQKASISRSTFYRLFVTREDFYHWYGVVCGSLALDQIGRTLSWKEGTIQHFVMLDKERRSLNFCAQREVASDTSYMENHRRNVIYKTLTDFKHIPITEELKFQIHCYTHFESWVAPQWFRSELDMDARTFASYFEGCVPPLLHEALELEPR